MTGDLGCAAAALVAFRQERRAWFQPSPWETGGGAMTSPKPPRSVQGGRVHRDLQGAEPRQPDPCRSTTQRAGTSAVCHSCQALVRSFHLDVSARRRRECFVESADFFLIPPTPSGELPGCCAPAPWVKLTGGEGAGSGRGVGEPGLPPRSMAAAPAPMTWTCLSAQCPPSDSEVSSQLELLPRRQAECVLQISRRSRITGRHLDESPINLAYQSCDRPINHVSGEPRCFTPLAMVQSQTPATGSGNGVFNRCGYSTDQKLRPMEL